MEVMGLMLGEFATEILLKGQKVLPETAENAGFEFRFTELNDALKDIFEHNEASSVVNQV